MFDHFCLLFSLFFNSFFRFLFNIFLAFILVFVISKSARAEVLTMALGATSVAKSFFTAEGDVEVENIVFNVDDDMNQRGAVTLYLVVCYDWVLFDALRSDTAAQFKRRVETYVNDYPDKIVVLKWNIVAKKRVTSRIPVEKYYEKGSMSPVGGFFFVTYSSPGEHRYKIPGSWKGIEISLKRMECKLKQIN